MFQPVDYNFTLRDISSAWKGLERYIPDIITKLKIETNTALEFGVDHGYSSEALSNLFDKVIGVDSFIGDAHIIHEQGEEFYNTVKNSFTGTNVEIIKSSFENFIESNTNHYNLIHIDIVHEYQPTYECADWSIQHSDVVVLHDTISFPEIHRVCEDISRKHNANYVNIPNHHGLGVLYK